MEQSFPSLAETSPVGTLDRRDVTDTDEARVLQDSKSAPSRPAHAFPCCSLSHCLNDFNLGNSFLSGSNSTEYSASPVRDGEVVQGERDVAAGVARGVVGHLRGDVAWARGRVPSANGGENEGRGRRVCVDVVGRDLPEAATLERSFEQAKHDGEVHAQLSQVLRMIR